MRNKIVADILQEAAAKLEQADIYPLLSHALCRSTEFLHTYPDYELSGSELKAWMRCRKRRLKGEPVSYITGRREFYSLPFKVNKRALIPRPETELLVDEVLAMDPASLLDMGTGCGNIAIAVKYHSPLCRVTAVDRSGKALRLAEQNARFILGTHDIRFIRSTYFSRVEPQDFDVIVSNPPYIERGLLRTLQPEVRRFEPRSAIDGGREGLSAYRAISAEARRYLAPGGRIILEIDPRLLDALIRLSGEEGYRIVKIEKDLAGAVRMLVLE